VSSSPRVLSEIIERLSDEIDHAREKHPRGDRFVALTCEFLELTRAIQSGESKQNIREEALQVACTAIRFIEESLDGHNH
jgi:NTP pyrophosphatase (non-canonical NTP hydrolase)